jgi:hypothetical protein
VFGSGQSDLLQRAGAESVCAANDGSGNIYEFTPAGQAEIEATGLPPSNDAESAVVQTLTPGNYTAIVGGKNNTIGVALVEVYGLNYLPFTLV